MAETDSVVVGLKWVFDNRRRKRGCWVRKGEEKGLLLEFERKRGLCAFRAGENMATERVMDGCAGTIGGGEPYLTGEGEESGEKRNGPCMWIEIYWSRNGPCKWIEIYWITNGPWEWIEIYWSRNGPRCKWISIHSFNLMKTNVKKQKIIVNNN